MSSNNDGTIVILSSPSGAGKTTLVNLLLKKKNFTNSVSHTTRKPRSNEVNGKDYFFVSSEEFQNLIKNNEFLEYAKVFNFVLPPSKEILYERLTNRDMKDKLIASERMKEFYKDIKHWIDYDYVVINDELNKCYEEISKIIDSSCNDIKKIKYDNNLIKEHIKKLTS